MTKIPIFKSKSQNLDDHDFYVEIQTSLLTHETFIKNE